MKHYHPIPCFLYFIGIMVLAMTLYQPIFLATAFLILIVAHYTVDRCKALAEYIKLFLFITLFMIILNPLISHRGATILFYLFDNPITFESVVYGLTSALSLLVIMTSFILFNLIIDTDKLLYLFSRFAQKTTFVVMLCIRFVPLLKRQIRELSDVQQYKYTFAKNASWMDKVRNKMVVLNTLVSRSLEDSIWTAQSMRARGYGVHKKRSFYFNYTVTFRDCLLTIVVVVATCGLLLAWHLGIVDFVIYPQLSAMQYNVNFFSLYCIFGLFTAIPILLKAGETLLWRYSEPKN